MTIGNIIFWTQWVSLTHSGPNNMHKSCANQSKTKIQCEESSWAYNPLHPLWSY
ncbi:hypothetical protein I79_018093 [Cricetulus griseus]|uniref:Uncharacterized protein n=1 Tax=Cricetulus griseus TaxID=10029 RepID=G3I3S5_CRIGR|nr:hypothetical protein I79_018093 [Cricetulus griseus]